MSWLSLLHLLGLRENMCLKGTLTRAVLFLVLFGRFVFFVQKGDQKNSRKSCYDTILRKVNVKFCSFSCQFEPHNAWNIMEYVTTPVKETRGDL